VDSNVRKASSEIHLARADVYTAGEPLLPGEREESFIQIWRLFQGALKSGRTSERGKKGEAERERLAAKRSSVTCVELASFSTGLERAFLPASSGKLPF